jgi:cytosine/adenosine deaminase-related metal-dependent hydrolase
LVRSGFAALSLDATLLTPSDDDAVAEAVEAGVGLLLGLVPTAGGSAPVASAHDVAAPARELWHRTGLPPDGLARVAVTPACGLAGRSPQDARATLELCAATARSLTDDPEQSRG